MVDREKLRLAGWAAAALVAVLLAVRLLGGSGDGGAGVTVDPAGVATGSGAPRGSDVSGAGAASGGSPSGGSAGSELLVQVAGEVARPGVYRVPPGSRVQDAVAQAGGLTRKADQAGVNLVARVQDGQQVIVPRRGAGGVAASAAAAGGTALAGGGPTAPVSLSSATAAQLDTLDGIGPALAQRIIDYRQAHGGFSSVDQLRQVSGIGDKRLAAIRKSVTP